MLFRVLGPVEALAGERVASVGSERRRTILAVLLAAQGRTVTTAGLIDAVWDEDPPPSARKSLQSHLSRLRGELRRIEPAAPQPVVATSDGYRVDLEDHRLDAARFESLVARARAAAQRPEQVVALLEEAQGLWRGTAFGELGSLPALRAEARRLEGLRAAAAADRIDALLARGRHEEVLGELEATATERPLDERCHAQLLLALYRSGRQGDALATYGRLRERLRDELGADPAPQLRELHEHLLRQDPALDAPTIGTGVATGHAGPPSPSAGPAAPAGPAAAPDGLIGRETDVAAVASLVTGTALVTLLGPGGVGKTRLAEQVVARLSDEFDDGVATCPLAPVRDADSVGDALVTALGIQPTGDRTALETLVLALGDRRLLLLLDNCEHLLEAVAPVVEAVLARCPRVTVLATSRERLRVPGERVHAVTPLPVPPEGADATAVLATAAGRLFHARAEAVEPTFALTEHDAPAVAELCRRLDGMPLAIELAAVRVRALAPADLAARLDERFALLASGPHRDGGRHRTLEAVVAWSYELLGTAEAALFDRLSVFAGSFTIDVVEEVCRGGPIARAEVAGLFGELVDKSMVVVQRDEDAVRYRLLDTLRDFGVRRLAETGATEALRRAHAAHHLELVDRLGPRIRGAEERAAVAGIDGTIDDLRAAVGYLIGVGDVDGALRLPAALGEYLFYRLRDEITTWARRALALPGAASRPAHAAALATAAIGATSRGECERAGREGRAALELVDGQGPVALGALTALGAAALYEGRFAELRDVADRQHAIATRLDAPYYGAFAGVLRVLGHHYGGEQDAALAAAADLQRDADASGSPTMQAFAHYCHGEIHLDTRPAEATASLEEAVSLARTVGNRLIEGVSLVSLASLLGRRGRTRQALTLFREVVAHWARLGDYTHQLTTFRNLVALLAALDADELAATLHGAVTAGLAPSFGPEAQRLEAAWQRVEGRLGPHAAARAAARGRELSVTGMGAEVLAQLDALLAEHGGRAAVPVP